MLIGVNVGEMMMMAMVNEFLWMVMILYEVTMSDGECIIVIFDLLHWF